jgi:hypothetical protein
MVNVRLGYVNVQGTFHYQEQRYTFVQVFRHLQAPGAPNKHKPSAGIPLYIYTVLATDDTGLPVIFSFTSVEWCQLKQ